jgi:hypothetical protein
MASSATPLYDFHTIAITTAWFDLDHLILKNGENILTEAEIQSE